VRNPKRLSRSIGPAHVRPMHRSANPIHLVNRQHLWNTRPGVFVPDLTKFLLFIFHDFPPLLGVVKHDLYNRCHLAACDGESQMPRSGVS